MGDWELRCCTDVVSILGDLLSVHVKAYVREAVPACVDKRGGPVPCGGLGSVHTAVIGISPLSVSNRNVRC